jgi:hypothetical protein
MWYSFDFNCLAGASSYDIFYPFSGEYRLQSIYIYIYIYNIFTKDRPVLSSEGAPHKNITVTVKE